MKRIRIMAAGLLMAGVCGAINAQSGIEKAGGEAAAIESGDAESAGLDKSAESSELTAADGGQASLDKQYVEAHKVEIRSGTFSSTVEALPECLELLNKGANISVAITDKSPDLAALSSCLDGYNTTLDLSACTGLKEIPAKAFYLKSNIKAVVLPASIEKIGEKSFSRTSIEEIEIPSATKEIGDFAFAGTKIREANIPSGVTSYGVGAFAENGSLRAVNADASSSILKSEDGVLFTRDGLTLVAYPAGKEGDSYEIPASVISIGTEAFAYNGKIKSVKLPSTLVRICGYAFKGCSSISEIELPATLVSIGQDAFDGTSLKSLTIPKATVALGKNPFNSCSSLSEINVEDGNLVYKSEDGVLYSNGGNLVRFPCAKEAGDFAVPQDIAEIEPYAFENVKSLTSVTLAGGTRIIDKYAFKNCSSLKRLESAESLVKIGRQAFYGCPVENLPDYYVGTVDSYVPNAVDAK